MAGEDAVCALAADRERAPFQMAHSDLEHVVARAVVDGKRDFDGRDLDISHDAGGVDAQLAEIVLALFVRQGKEAAS